MRAASRIDASADATDPDPAGCGARGRASISIAPGLIRQRQKGDTMVKVSERPRCKYWPDMAWILIVEAQINIRHTIASLLEQAGHRAAAVATLAEAAGILAVNVPDLLATMSC
jgi:hypothetical protein